MKVKINPKYIEKRYDEIASKFAKGDYESYRWGNRAEKSRYISMSASVKKISKDFNGFKKYVELGPGPGTWTRFFLEKNPDAKFTLVDISSEMLKQAKNKLKGYKNIKYIKGDFNKVNLKEKFDFFFSSRAIEYVPDKEKTFKKIYDILEKGAKGAIITKTPHPIRDLIYEKIGREVRIEHKDQISPKQMKSLLEKNGFTNVKLYPVVVEFPPSATYNIPWINRKLYKIFSNKKPNFISRVLSECYLVTFKKK